MVEGVRIPTGFDVLCAGLDQTPHLGLHRARCQQIQVDPVLGHLWFGNLHEVQRPVALRVSHLELARISPPCFRGQDLRPRTPPAEILGRSQNTFVQAIYSTRVPAYYQRRTALLGDAGSLFPPFTASGVFKAMNNAIDLGVALGRSGDLDEALAAWNRRQLAHATATEGPAAAMEQAWIFSMPDVGSMSHDAYAAWTRGFLTEFRAGAAADQPSASP